MAYENIQLQDPNFCLGPQAGTVCTIDLTNPTTVLRVKNLTGTNIAEYSLSSNIVSSSVSLEYVGPQSLSSMPDGAQFFTFEKVTDTSCMIKRWQIRLAYGELALKEQVVKSSSGLEHYNAIDFAVEHYHRFLAQGSEPSYIILSNTTNIQAGTKLILGPSTDADNIGAMEVATVSSITTHLGIKHVNFSSPLTYEYVINDPVTFYSHVYIFSEDAYAAVPNKGSIYKLDAYSWALIQSHSSGIYRKVTAARWCPYVGGIASVVGTNALFVRPYDSYQNWRSMFLNNVTADGNDYFEVYDMIFDGYSVYKLQDSITLRDDSGDRTTYAWSEYNFHQDTLLPYANSMVTWMEQSIVTGYYKTVDINAQVRDQYHVGLLGADLNFYKSGDPNSEFDPLGGTATTDSDGKATIEYTSGDSYSGHTEITTRTNDGSNYTGSIYVWTSNNILSFPVFDAVEMLMFALKEIEGDSSLRAIPENYQFGEAGSLQEPYTIIFAKSYFTSIGGDWGPHAKLYDYEPDYGDYYDKTVVATWLPLFYRGDDHLDAPRQFTGGGFTNWPYNISNPLEEHDISNQIRQDAAFESTYDIRSLTDFVLYDSGGDPYYIYTLIFQPDESGEGQISQMKLAHHTHWVDGAAYDYLWTYLDIDQFVFVSDAIPTFYSEKNPVDTYIWLRLRPFAYSLNSSTLRMWVRELSYVGDTGYEEVTSEITITSFDAGGGILGLEVYYTPSQDFKYESTVFVRIEVYDQAATPNFVYVNYWFKTTPDYKAPYLLNLSPNNGDTNVAVDSNIYFEIKDVGTGLDRSTLEILVNSRLVNMDYVTIEEVDRYYFKVTYNPPENLYFSKDYKVTVRISDTSPAANAMNSAYSFTTADSSGIQLVDPFPGVCKRGIERFEDVSIIVLGDGNGVDRDSIRMQVYNKDVNPTIVPIIYRIS